MCLVFVHLQLLLVTGNTNSPVYAPISSNACFYINVNTFVVSSAPSLNVGRFMHALVLLPNGIVLAIGGSSASGQALSSIEMFDTFAGYWTSVAASLGTARIGLCAFLLPTTNQAGANHLSIDNSVC